MARAMIKAMDLPLKFWAEAVYTAAYIQNRTSTRALENKTPFEGWNGTKPTLSHMKVFGSICYVHIPDEKRKKWDDKSKKAIFVGYSSQTKGYRVYLLEEDKLTISRDVIFEEGSKWDWSKKEVIRQYDLPMELVDKEQGPRVDDSGSSDEESTERRSPIVNHSNQNLDSSDEDSSHPNKKTRSLEDILLNAPYADIEYSVVSQGCYASIEEPTLFEEAIKHSEWIEAMEE